MELKRREGESVGSFLHRFTKKVRQSGILVEAKKRRFQRRKSSKLKKRLSALYRSRKRKEVEKAKKFGIPG
ncbi:30S ribosomal protein S21 [Candidatus Wolfebacteria bacterium]|nr:30S ribosomal protein S21 [Candidatus Wolfebacteria bacterium]